MGGYFKIMLLNIVNDNNLGGVKTSVDLIRKSNVKGAVIALLQDTSELVKNNKITTTIFHCAGSWKVLFKLFLLRKRLGRLIIVEHHYDKYFKPRSRIRFNLMLSLFYGLADKVVVLSKNQKDWITKYIATDKVVHIPPTVIITDLLKLDPPTAKPNLTIGSYGRFSPEKGFDLIIEAAKQLKQYSSIKWILGGYGAEESKLKELAKDLPIEFVGKITDVSAFLDKCDLVVIPSRRETFGLTCLEAKAAARTVLASRIGGLVDQLDDSYLFESDNVKDLCNKISSLFYVDRELIGLENRETVKDDFDRFIKQWEELIES